MDIPESAGAGRCEAVNWWKISIIKTGPHWLTVECGNFKKKMNIIFGKQTEMFSKI